MRQQVLFVAHAWDMGTEAVIAAVRAELGVGHVQVVRPEVLGLCRWWHRVAGDGVVTTRLVLPGGLEIDSSVVSVGVNQLQHLPQQRYARSPRKDHDYALAELDALVTSWLASFGPRLLNPSGPHGMIGPTSQRAWLLLAHRNGLPICRSGFGSPGSRLPAPTSGECTMPFEYWPGDARGAMPAALGPIPGARSTVLVAGGEVVGELAERFGPACLSATRAAGARAVSWRFVDIDGQPHLAEVDPLPRVQDAREVSVLARLVVGLATGPGAAP